ncbi:cupredoxin domain-containing protein [Pseudoduganella sp. OTU4001]|uniref:cupredoxin domain-containing protein n=1 Tax=Pseudoduganella sp. OTU4001 TaxID=3043854 RepID=UPI00313CF58C
MSRKLFAAAAALLLAIACAAAWAAFAPIRPASRDALFEIPKGTWERRMAGDKAEILPDTITLVLGVNDVLLLRNSDSVPQIFGPVLIMPGQDFRLPFEQAGEHPFACTAHASGQMTVVVQATPQAGWQRLQWRLQSLIRKAPWRD